MMPQSNMMLSFILMALGGLGIILSFLVPDRRKSLISIAIGGIIILVGVINLGSSMTDSWRWRRRLESLRNDRQQVDMQKLREEFKKKAEEAQKMKEPPRKQP